MIWGGGLISELFPHSHAFNPLLSRRKEGGSPFLKEGGVKELLALKREGGSPFLIYKRFPPPVLWFCGFFFIKKKKGTENAFPLFSPNYIYIYICNIYM